jgi:hypothetical protein
MSWLEPNVNLDFCSHLLRSIEMLNIKNTINLENNA